MRIFLLFTFFLACLTSANSQQLYLEVGKTSSSFNFENSQGEHLENLRATSHNFISIGYRKNIFTENLFLNVNAGYRGYGSIGSDRALDNFFEWEVNYLGIGAGLDYEIYSYNDFTFYLKGSFSTEFLVHGIQTLNNQVFNLSGEEDFDTPIYVFRAGLGTQYKVSEKLNTFIQYIYGRSGTFKDIPGKLNINAHNFGVGLLINISRSLPDTQKVDNAELDELRKSLEDNSQRIKELEAAKQQVDALKKQVMAKEKEIKSIKESIATALQPYEGTELRIKEVGGKVYITMGNDMLFNSGSSKISKEGNKALNDLGDVLAKNTDLNILIEGHTDNRPFKNGIMSNWDLSVKRATAVVEILTEDKKINPKNMMAAGKGEHEPIADNRTKEGRATNRRIKIIISPKLEELSKLIKE